MNHSISDFLIRIKNGYRAGRKTITSPSSNFRVAVADVLKRYGYISNYQVDGDIKKVITVDLSYNATVPVVTDIEILSKPGRRLYETSINLPWGKTPKSLIVISTSAGIMSQKEASSKKLGGEIIAEIY